MNEPQDQHDPEQPALVNVAYLVELNPAELEREIVELTAKLSYVGELHAEATRKVAYAKLQRDEIEAFNRVSLRHQHELSGQKPTEKTLDAAITSLQPVMAAQRLLIEAEAEQARLRAQLRALECKERMLDLLGRRAIAEMKMDPAAAMAGASRGWNGATLG